MAPHSRKVCVKKILKLDVTIAALAACLSQASQHGGPLQWPVVLKWLTLIVFIVNTPDSILYSCVTLSYRQELEG